MRRPSHSCCILVQVELIEMPFTVISCPDVLLVNLERVGFSLRHFDMAIIFKVCAACLRTCSMEVSSSSLLRLGRWHESEGVWLVDHCTTHMSTCILDYTVTACHVHINV